MKNKQMEIHYYEAPDEGEFCAICGNRPVNKWHTTKSAYELLHKDYSNGRADGLASSNLSR